MLCGRPIDLHSRLLILLVCWVSTSLIPMSEASGVRIETTVGEENQLKRETQHFLHHAYVPGRQQRFPVGQSPSQQSGPQLLPDTTTSSGTNEPPHPNIVMVRASKLKRPVKRNPPNAVPHDLVHPQFGTGSSTRKGRYLQPRIFRGVWGHRVGTEESARSSNHGRLNPRRSTLEQKQTRANQASVALLSSSSHRSPEPRGFRKSQTHQNSSDETNASVHKLGQSGGVLSNGGEETWQKEGLSETQRFPPRFLLPLAGKPNVVLDSADENDVHPSTQDRTIPWSHRLSSQAPPHDFSPVLSSRSGALWKSEWPQSNEKASMSDGLSSFGNKSGKLTTTMLDNQALFITKVSKPAVKGPNEGPKALKVGKWYLFNSYKTSGKREVAGVSGARQHSGQSLSPSARSQNMSPSLKMSVRQPSSHRQDQLSEQEAASSDVHPSFGKAIPLGTQSGRSMAHFKDQHKGFKEPSRLKSQESVMEVYKRLLAIPYGGLSKKTKLKSSSYDKTTNSPTEKAHDYTPVSQKYGFSQRAEVVYTTTAPLEAQRGPRKHSVQSGSIILLPPRDIFRSDSVISRKSKLSANDVPSQQEKYKVLQPSSVQLKLNMAKSESKPGFRGLQPLIPDMGYKPYLSGYTSNSGKYPFGGMLGLNFRTSTSGPLEGADASDTNTAENDIIKPDKNKIFSFKAITREMTPRLSDGYHQVGSAVYRIGTKTSHAEAIVEPGVIRSIPDGPRSPIRYGRLPSQVSSFPGPFEGEVSSDVGAQFTKLKRQLTPVDATKGKSYSDPRRPHSSIAAFDPTNTIKRKHRPTGSSPHARWKTERASIITRVSQPRTGRAPPAVPLNYNFLNRPSRPMVQGRRSKVNGVRVESPSPGTSASDSGLPTEWASKIAGAFFNVTFSDILGSAHHTSEMGSPAEDGKSSGRPRPTGNPSSWGRSSPGEGSSSPRLDSRPAPKRRRVKGYSEQGGEGFWFVPVRGGDGLPVERPRLSNQAHQVSQESPNSLSRPSPKAEWSYLKTSAVDGSVRQSASFR
ncbi:E3 ubiquitin-protein ligase-like isoform X1 [Gadus chalcogrammus]|uniref:E3 ubiquitin-protein ligase-like isoform X1 n=1 Tax=Gadus chalcogrammus TaxID=1042646 RepID=UPI0024C4BFA3|nr:E3 ubiquitin-protein ligase-like isoform X1 [Gadus chalcogrammus]